MKHKENLFRLKLKADLAERLEQTARDNGRPIQDEIIARIEHSLANEDRMSCLAKMVCWLENKNNINFVDKR